MNNRRHSKAPFSFVNRGQVKPAPCLLLIQNNGLHSFHQFHDGSSGDKGHALPIDHRQAARAVIAVENDLDFWEAFVFQMELHTDFFLAVWLFRSKFGCAQGAQGVLKVRQIQRIVFRFFCQGFLGGIGLRFFFRNFLCQEAPSTFVILVLFRYQRVGFSLKGDVDLSNILKITPENFLMPQIIVGSSRQYAVIHLIQLIDDLRIPYPDIHTHIFGIFARSFRFLSGLQFFRIAADMNDADIGNLFLRIILGIGVVDRDGQLRLVKAEVHQLFLGCVMLGIIIGVMALVVLVSLVSGATSSVTDTISSLGSSLLTVTISDGKGLPVTMDTLKQWSKTEKDLGSIAPYASDTLTGSADGESGSMTVYGTTTDYYEIQGLQLAMGRWLKQSDMENNTYACLINETAAEAVQDVLLDHGALAVLSLDDTMAVKLEVSTNLRPGDGVCVAFTSGKEVDGRVKSNQDGTLIVTVEDEDYAVGAQVTVKTEDGQRLGTGELYIFNPWNATAYSGTISGISVSEGTTVSVNQTLFTISDPGNSAEYQRLIDQRHEYEELMQELFQMYRTETITAPCDGIVTGVDKNGAFLLADTGGSWVARLLSFFTGDTQEGFVAYTAKVVSVSDNGMELLMNPHEVSVSDLTDISHISADISGMTESWGYTGDQTVYIQTSDGLLQAAGTAKVGDILLAVGDADTVQWFVVLNGGSQEGVVRTDNATSSPTMTFLCTSIPQQHR